jgi:hypothetical protein
VSVCICCGGDDGRVKVRNLWRIQKKRELKEEKRRPIVFFPIEFLFSNYIYKPESDSKNSIVTDGASHGVTCLRVSAFLRSNGKKVLGYDWFWLLSIDTLLDTTADANNWGRFDRQIIELFL